MAEVGRLLRLFPALFLAALLAWGAGGTLEGAQRFQRGDSDAKNGLNITDAIHSLGFLYLGTPAQIPCKDAADSNDDGKVNISDPVHTLGFLFLGTPPPPPPYGTCGEDPTEDAIGCESFEPCPPPVPPAPPILEPPPSPTRVEVIELRGTAPPGLLVTVNGGVWIAKTRPSPDGAFSVEVGLNTNRLNRLFADVEDSEGLTSAPATVEVIHDSEPPFVYVDEPADGSQVLTGEVTVTGRVSDILSGFMGLNVTVNGIAANIAIGIGTNGTFERPGVLLTPGSNSIVVAAMDAAGNSKELPPILIERREPQAGEALIEAVSGNGQRAPIHGTLPERIAVRARRADGAPLEGKLVIFQVARSDGRLATGPSPAPEDLVMTLAARTGADGLAAANWTLGSDAGCGNNRVKASGEGLAGEVLFCASATPGPAAQINIGSGNNQRCEAGSTAPELLKAWVSDGCNGIAGVNVTFRVVQGSGKVEGLETVTVPTSPTGHAAVSFLLGPEPGNHRVEADFQDNPTGPAVFTAFALVRNDSRPTTFSGLVLDNSQQPIQGAVCVLDVPGFEGVNLPATSDLHGRFQLEAPRGGPASLLVDGRFATHVGGEAGRDLVPGSFPFLVYEVVLVPNAENSLPGPVLLPPLDPDNAVAYEGTSEVVLRVKGIEGLEMRIGAGTLVTLRDGTKVGPGHPGSVSLSLNQVHYDDVPMPLPDGAAPPFAWTLQPAGARFDPPIRVKYPNMSALPPGAIANFLSFNHDTGKFEIVSSGHVSRDGSSIDSDPGSGVTVAGWGCNCPPYSVTGECKKCAQTGTCPTDPDCILNLIGLGAGEDVCDGGMGVNEEDDFDPCSSATYKGLLQEYDEGFPEEVLQALNSANSEIQHIDDGIGSYLYDEYSVVIDQMPPGVTPEDFLGNLATNMNGTINDRLFDKVNTFKPRRTDGPPNVGDIYDIDIFGPEFFANANGSVVLSEITDSHFVFTTIYTPELRQHPEFGSRQFGFDRNSDGSITFYTRGASRAAGPAERFIGAPFQEIGWWRAMMGISNAIDALHGRSRPMSFQSSRHRLSTRSPCGSPQVPIHVEGHAAGARDSGRFAYRIDYVDAETPGLELRVVSGFTDPGGVFSVDLPPAVFYRVDLYNVETGLYGTSSGQNLSAGPLNLGVVHVTTADGEDLDGDGLGPVAESILRCDPLDPDTDGDGVDDGTEAKLGMLPFALDMSWSLTANGQVVQANSDGTFAIPNISAPDIFGPDGPGSRPDSLSDDFLRVLGTSIIGGKPYYAFSEPFQIQQGQTYIVPELTITPNAPARPRSLRIESERSVLRPGELLQLMVTGTLGDGNEADLTPRIAWTTYRTSNPRVATVEKDGLVTARGRGTAYITAVNEGATAVKRLDAARDTVRIRLCGVVRLPDGTAAEGASVRTTFGGQTSVGPDGAFAFEVEAPLGASFSVVITYESGGRRLSRAIKVETPDDLEKVELGVIVLVEAPRDLFPHRLFETGNSPRSVASGDLDADGDTDLAVANSSSNTVSILRNQGDGTFAAQVPYGVGADPSSVALGDLDGDGDAELAVANAGSSTVSVLRNQGDGTFAAQVPYGVGGVGSAPTSVALGDVDGDGDADLAVANFGFGANSVSVLLNERDGTFATQVPYGVGGHSYSVALGDLDGDGAADVAVANYGYDTVSILLNEGDGTFSTHVQYGVGAGPSSVALGDLDGDGDADLAVANYGFGANTVSVLLNEENGTFAAQVPYGVGGRPFSVALEDLDGDGDADLAVANFGFGFGANTVSVLLNEGDGTFAAQTPYGVGSSPRSVVLGDLDGDGDAELAVANTGSNTVSVLLNEGGGTFAIHVQYGVGISPSSVALGDLDGDGDADLAVANSGFGANSVSVLLNEGDGTFAIHVQYGVGTSPSSVALGDLDLDGDADLAVADQDSNTISVLLNQSVR